MTNTIVYAITALFLTTIFTLAVINGMHNDRVLMRSVQESSVKW